MNAHRWVMYVALCNDKDSTGKFIDSVVYHLHPTFHPSLIKMTQFPFLLSRVGWGYFTIKIDIAFKKWIGVKDISLEHELLF